MTIKRRDQADKQRKKRKKRWMEVRKGKKVRIKIAMKEVRNKGNKEDGMKEDRKEYR